MTKKSTEASVPAANILHALSKETDHWAGIAARLDTHISGTQASEGRSSAALQDIDQLRQGLFVLAKLLADLAVALPDHASTQVHRDQLGPEIVPVHIRAACLGYGVAPQSTGAVDLF